MFLSAMHEVSNFSTFSPTFAIFPLHVETSFLILRKGIFSEYTFSCKVTEHSNWSCKKGIYWLGTSKGKQCSEFRGSRGALWTLSLSLPEAGSISQPGFSLMVTQGLLSSRLSSEHKFNQKQSKLYFLAVYKCPRVHSNLTNLGLALFPNKSQRPGSLSALTGLVWGHLSTPDAGNRVTRVKGRRGGPMKRK